MSFLYQAKEYAKRGFCVIPIRKGTKLPLIPWSEFQERHPTNEELEKWFSSDQNDMAIVTGRVSNLAVVDCDGEAGLKSRDELNLNASIEIKTRNNGCHLWFKNFQGSSNSVKRIPGIDIRGEGGYVLVPPSPGYEAYKNIGVLTEFPPALIEKFTTARSAPGWVAEEISKLAPGYHQTPFTRIVGKLHRGGWASNDIREFLVPFCIQENFALSELDTIIASVTRYPVASNGLEVWSSSDLLGVQECKWVVKNVIPARTITILGGLPGSCKTWFALDLALELTKPNPQCFGLFDGVQSRVLYVDEESSPAKLSERIHFLLAEKEGCRTENIFWSVGQSFDFGDKIKIDKLKNAIYTNNVDFVVIDSLNCVNRHEENSATEMSKFFQLIKEIVREFGVCFFLVDHEGKDVHVKEREGVEPRAEDLRGSNAKGSSCDQIFNLRKRGDSLTLYHTKAKWTEAMHPSCLSLLKTAKGVKLEWLR